MGLHRSVPSLFGSSPSATRLAGFVLAFLLAGGWVVPLVFAQEPPPWAEEMLGQEESQQEEEADEWPSAGQLRAERQRLDIEIAELRSTLRPQSAEQAAGDAADPSASDSPEPARAAPTAAETSVAAQLRWLEKTRSLLGQQLDELRRAEALATAESDFEALASEGISGLVDQPPPFGFDALDAVLSRLEGAESRRRVLEETVAAGAESLEQSERRLARTRHEQRQLRDRLEAAGVGERLRIELDLQLSERVERAAEEELTELRLQLANDSRELELVEEQSRYLSESVRWIRERLQPTDDQLAAREAELNEDQERSRTRMAALRTEIETAQASLLRAERRAGLVEATGAEATGAEETSPEVSRLREALELLERRQRLLEDHSDRIDTEAALWRIRHRLASQKPPDASERKELVNGLERDVSELERERRLLEAASVDLRTLAERLEGQDGAADPERRQRIAAQLDFLAAELAHVDGVVALARRVLEEASQEGLGAEELATLGWQRVVDLWNWSITTVEDRPITLGKVFIALLLLIAGYIASKRLSSSLGKVLRERFGISSGGAAALQNIAFYLMLVAFLLWAMRLVSIPLTVFTLLGGVLAIGIGFGSQNVVNNFISGLILLVERPVKVGDLIEVEGTVGTVERIGLRSARVRAGDNTHVIVPNSTFLEQKVLNWTVSDDLVRTHVDVGIAYGSPTREAAKLMERALKDEALVVQNMPKEVMFVEFGDNALLMRAYFWIHVRGYLDKLRAESQLRFHIDDLFRDADITIAFPQRDVHLDTLTPLEVRVLGAGASEGDRSNPTEGDSRIRNP